ncbi:MAG: response regulator [Deltaproteobacteria bacterium]|nr:MAG: response regulator [Deltaproteobacteria bacterium]
MLQTVEHEKAAARQKVEEPMRVLLVDDEELVRLSTGRVLRYKGHDVVDASDGRQALRLYGEQRPDIVMLDIDMPGLSGQETLVALLELDPEAVVIMITGHTDPKQARALCELGAQSLLGKPWSLAELMDAIETATKPRPAVAAPSGPAD